MGQIDELIKELDNLVEGEEQLEDTRDSVGTKIVFNKLFDYDPIFRQFMEAALGVCIGCLMYNEREMLSGMMTIFKLSSQMIRNNPNYQSPEGE